MISEGPNRWACSSSWAMPAGISCELRSPNATVVLAGEATYESHSSGSSATHELVVCVSQPVCRLASFERE